MPGESDLPSCLIEALNHSADSLNTQLNRGPWLSPTIGPGMPASTNAAINIYFAAMALGDPSVAEECMPIIYLVFANLKPWLLGTHHGVSHQHLQACLNELTFRFNRRFYPFNAFRSQRGIAGGATASTYARLYSGEWPHPTSRGFGRKPDRQGL
jgi:hypothetical protein